MAYIMNNGLTGADKMNARNGISLDTLAASGKVISITAYGAKKDTETDSDGTETVKTISILKDSDGNIYSGVSAVAYNFLDDLEDALADGDLKLPVKVKAVSTPCKGNASRKYVALHIVG